MKLTTKQTELMLQLLDQAEQDTACTPCRSDYERELRTVRLQEISELIDALRASR